MKRAIRPNRYNEISKYLFGTDIKDIENLFSWKYFSDVIKLYALIAHVFSKDVLEDPFIENKLMMICLVGKEMFLKREQHSQFMHLFRNIKDELLFLFRYCSKTD